MAKEAQIVFTVNPAQAEAAIARIEARGIQAAERIQQAMQGAYGAGGTGGRGGGGRGPRGGTPQPQGFGENFMFGFGKAGGFAGALSTVIKYGAAYKAVEAGMNAILTPGRLTVEFLNRGTKAWIEYEDAMAKAQRTMQMPGMRSDVIKQAFQPGVLEFLSKYRTTSEDLATAIYELGSAGANASQVMQEWAPVAKLNIALQGDMTQTARTLTQMLKIHGAEMGKEMTDREKMIRLSGIVAKTWQVEQFELSDLAASYKYVAANAGTLKIKAEELVPLLGFMSTYGLRGSIGGTGLNQFLTQLSRTISVTKSGLIQLKKETRGGAITVDTGVKAGDVKGPIQLFGALGRAMKSDPNAAWIERLQKSGIAQDLFNVRGARPVMLIIEKLGEYMKRFGDVSKWSTQQAEAFVEQLVQMQQNTPAGQIDIMNNKIDVAGQRFLMAAVGATTFTDALVRVNAWIDNIAPKIEAFGTTIRGAWAFWSQNPIMHPIKATNAQKKVEAQAIASKVQQEAAGVFLKSGGDRNALYKWIRTEQIKLQRTYDTPTVGGGSLVTAPRSPVASSLFGEMLKGKELRKKGSWGTAADATVGRYIALSDIKHDPSAVFDISAVLKREAAQQKSGVPGILDAFKAGVSKVPSGGGAGGPAKDYRDALTMITDGIIDYDDALSVLTESMRRLDLEQSRLDKTTSGRLITNKQITESDALAARQIDASTKMIVALDAQMTELQREESALASRATRAPDISTRSKARHELAQVRVKMEQNKTNRLQEEYRKQEAAERAAALHVEQAARARDRVNENNERVAYNRQLAIEALDDSLAALDRTDGIYGETVATQVARVGLLNDKLAQLSSYREKDEAELVSVTAAYKKYGDALKEIRAEKASATSPAMLAAFGADMAKQIMGGPLPADKVAEYVSNAESRIKDLNSAIRAEGQGAAEASAGIEKLAQSHLNLSASLDAVNARWSRIQDTFEAGGGDWSVSIQRSLELTDKLKGAFNEATVKWQQLQARKGNLSPEEFAKEAEAIAALPSQALNNVTRYSEDLRKASESIMRDIEDMQDSWGKGDEAAYRAIDRKVSDMRRQYSGNADLLAMVNQYESVAKANVQMEKFYKKREDIESRWGEAFMKFFSDLSSDSGNAMQNLWQSILGSVQEMILQEILQKALSGVFDSIASAITGVDPAKVQESAASASVATAKAAEAAAIATVNPQLTQMGTLIAQVNAVLAEMATRLPTVQGPRDATGGLIQSLGGFMGSSGGSGVLLSALSGNAPLGPFGMTASGGGGMGGGISIGTKWPKGMGLAGKILGSIGYGTIAGSISGAIFKTKPEVAQTNSAIGGIIGGAVGGPVGALVGGFLGGMFGSKQKSTPKPPNRELYGMPEFEYESYLYNLTKPSQKAMRPYPSYARGITVHDSRKVTIHINGGDLTEVKNVVNDALLANFGNVAVAQAAKGSIYR